MFHIKNVKCIICKFGAKVQQKSQTAKFKVTEREKRDKRLEIGVNGANEG